MTWWRQQGVIVIIITNKIVVSLQRKYGLFLDTLCTHTQLYLLLGSLNFPRSQTHTAVELYAVRRSFVARYEQLQPHASFYFQF